MSTIQYNQRIDRRAFVRGKWSTRHDYVFAMAGLFMGITNFWTLPTIVMQHGYLTFVLIYMFALFTFGFPILLLQMGIGQTTQVSTIRVFNSSAYFSGLGISQLMIILLFTSTYSTYIVYAFYYLFFTIFEDSHWNYCNNNFNTFNCSSSYETKTSAVLAKYRIFSTEEFWNYEVLGIHIYPENRGYDVFVDGVGIPPIGMVLLVILVWFLISILLLLDFVVSEKIVWFTVSFPLVSCLIMSASFFSNNNPFMEFGALMKIDTSFFLNFPTYVEAYCYVSYTLFLGYGCTITMASYNHYYDNIFRDSLVIISAIFVSTSITSYLAFGLDNYFQVMENTTNIAGPEFFFVLLLRAYGDSKFFTLLALVTIICFCVDTLMGVTEYLFIIISDIDPCVRREKLKYLMFVYALSVMFSMVSCFMITPFGASLSRNTESAPLISLIFVFMEMLGILHTYGIKKLANTFVNVLGFPCMKYFIYSIVVYILLLVPCVTICKFYLVFQRKTYEELFVDISLISVVLVPILGLMFSNWVRVNLILTKPIRPMKIIQYLYRNKCCCCVYINSEHNLNCYMAWDS